MAAAAEDTLNSQQARSDHQVSHPTANPIAPAGRRRRVRRSAQASVAVAALVALSFAAVSGNSGVSDAGVVATVVASGNSWQYRNDGVSLNAGWKIPGATTAGWSTGTTPIGKSVTGVVTTLPSVPITTYFVKDVQVSGATTKTYQLRVRADDGAIVYFNGLTVARTNVPFGEIPNTANAWSAITTAPPGWDTYIVPKEFLKDGSNRIAVELHQASDNAGDAYFDLQLTALDNGGDTTAPPAPTVTIGTKTTTAITLQWNKPTSDVAGFRVRRGAQTVSLSREGTRSFFDQQLTPGANYAYSVSAFDGSGNESPSAVVNATTNSAGTKETIEAVGDIGQKTESGTMLLGAAASGGSTLLALGDLGYNGPGSEPAWCTFVRNRIGQTKQVAVVPGNHEADDGPDGLVNNFVGCLGAKPATSGNYPTDYSFNIGSVARVFVISPELMIAGKYFNLAPGGTVRTWLVNGIAEARAQGVPWVIVAMHKPCITVGVKACEIRPDLQEVLSTADLVLAGHDHTYQRTHQIGTGTNCTTVDPVTANPYCITDDGSDGLYKAGKGNVQVISGVGGQAIEPLTNGDAQDQYVVMRMGQQSWSPSVGYLRLVITPTSMQGRFYATTGAFADTFTINK
jgi:hypothetical protein